MDDIESEDQEKTSCENRISIEHLHGKNEKNIRAKFFQKSPILLRRNMQNHFVMPNTTTDRGDALVSYVVCRK